MSTFSFKALGMIYFSLALCLFTATQNAQAAAFESADKKHFEELKVQALIQNKKLMWITSAAWCGPCAELEEVLEKQPTLFAPEISEFIIFHTEQTWAEFSLFTDIAPFENLGFPGIYLFDPKTSRWDGTGMMSFVDQNADEVKLALGSFQKVGSVYTGIRAKYESLLNSGVSFSYSNPEGQYGVLDDLMTSAMYGLSFSDGAQFLKNLRQDSLTHPKQFEFDARYGMNEMIDRAAAQLLSSGAGTLSDLQAVDPEIFKHADPSNTYLDHTRFMIPIRNEWILGNYEKAAELCNELAPKRNGPGPQFRGSILCKELDVLSGKMNESDVVKYIASLTETQKGMGSDYLTSLSLLAGSFESAIEMQKLYLVSLKSSYGGFPVLRARIERASNERISAFEQKKRHP